MTYINSIRKHHTEMLTTFMRAGVMSLYIFTEQN